MRVVMGTRRRAHGGGGRKVSAGGPPRRAPSPLAANRVGAEKTLRLANQTPPSPGVKSGGLESEVTSCVRLQCSRDKSIPTLRPPMGSLPKQEVGTMGSHYGSFFNAGATPAPTVNLSKIGGAPSCNEEPSLIHKVKVSAISAIWALPSRKGKHALIPVQYTMRSHETNQTRRRAARANPDLSPVKSMSQKWPNPVGAPDVHLGSPIGRP
ncbi:unnamed protein product [Merluccius merluccius]